MENRDATYSLLKAYYLERPAENYVEKMDYVVDELWKRGINLRQVDSMVLSLLRSVVAIVQEAQRRRA